MYFSCICVLSNNDFFRHMSSRVKIFLLCKKKLNFEVFSRNNSVAFLSLINSKISNGFLLPKNAFQSPKEMLLGESEFYLIILRKLDTFFTRPVGQNISFLINCILSFVRNNMIY